MTVRYNCSYYLTVNISNDGLSYLYCQIKWLTSNLSVRRSFWLDDEPAVTETGGLPGTITGVLGRISVGTRPMLWDMGVK